MQYAKNLKKHNSIIESKKKTMGGISKWKVKEKRNQIDYMSIEITTYSLSPNEN